jgi:hypothetical protein
MLCDYEPMLGSRDFFVDYANQYTYKKGATLHACPTGTYAIGYNDGKNELDCAYDIDAGYTSFQGPPFVSSGNNPPEIDNMHVCSRTNPLDVVIGVQATKNDLLCRELASTPAAPTTTSPAGFNPANVRGLLQAPNGMSLNQWRTITRNWLLHILNIPVPGQGDPSPFCITLSTPLSSLDPLLSGKAATNPNCVAGVQPLPVHIDSITPVTAPSYACTTGGSATPKYSADGETSVGVRQLYITYQSPVFPDVAEKAILSLPAQFSASGSYPAVVVTHGHQDTGEASTAACIDDPDHANALTLAQDGAVTLTSDTVTFGPYGGAPGYGSIPINNLFCLPGKPIIDGAFYNFDIDHYALECADPTGTFMPWFILDNIVRVSLLYDVPGVNPSEIGTAGLSLGGYQALWTAALDPRVSRTAVGGIYQMMSSMQSRTINNVDQEIPALSTDFINDTGKSTISPLSDLLNTADLAALIFPHALLSTWGVDDPGITSAGLVDTDTATSQILHVDPGTFIDVEFPKIRHAHEWSNAIADPFLVAASPSLPGGTYITDSSTGKLYVIAGGAPIQSPCLAACSPLQVTSALNGFPAVPADGTYLAAQPSGQIYRVVGGAPVYIPDPTPTANIPNPVPVPDAVIEQAGSGSALSGLAYRPMDGTLLTDEPSGREYRVAGGAPVYLPDPSVLSGSQATIQVSDATIDQAGSGGAYNHLNYHPADGTYLTGMPGGKVYEITRGVPYLDVTLPAPTGATSVDQESVDNAGQGGPWSHLSAPPPIGNPGRGAGLSIQEWAGIGCSVLVMVAVALFAWRYRRRHRWLRRYRRHRFHWSR